jgi:2-polyprenyl-3-methyl-5-hydroxy-6-metoxy-1,4-benzoquinol methylase
MRPAGVTDEGMASPKFVYQTDYSKDHPELYDFAGREVKAKKIVAVLTDYLGSEALQDKTALDVGCSSGIITHHLSKSLGRTCGVDIDAQAIAFANRQFGSEKLRYETSDGLVLAFADCSFDIVVCSQVYEHVPDADRLMSEIHRVLRPGGICYFSAGNRMSLIEPHYRLPFLSIVPKSVAHVYLRLLKRGDHYYETHRTLWGLRRLTRRFRVVDYTLRVLRQPARFCMEDVIREGSLLHHLMPIAVRPLYWAIPNYVWLLVK